MIVDNREVRFQVDSLGDSNTRPQVRVTDIVSARFAIMLGLDHKVVSDLDPKSSVVLQPEKTQHGFVYGVQDCNSAAFANMLGVDHVVRIPSLPNGTQSRREG